MFKFKVAKEKLSSKKYKVYLAFWLIYWGIAFYLVLSNGGAVIGTGNNTGKRYYLLFGSVIITMLFAVWFCFYRWGNYYKQKTESGHEYKPPVKWYHIGFMILADLYSYIVIETVNNADHMREIKPVYIFLNLFGGLIMCLILFLWFNSLRRACMTLVIFSTTMSFIFYFVYLARGQALQLIDIFSFGTAWGVAGKYEFIYSRWVTACLGFSLSFIAIMLHCPDRQLAFRKKSRLFMRLAAFLVMAAGYFLYVDTNWDGRIGVETDLWDIHSNYQDYGTNLGFFVVAKMMRTTPPSGYDIFSLEQTAKEYAAMLAAKDDDSEKIKPVNIICVMNEAWADYRNVSDKLTTTQSYMPFYDSMKDNVIKGKTLVNTHGGGTAKSEYEFLSGNSTMQYQGAIIPYVSFFTHDQYSLVSTLKDQGYSSTVLHPGKNGYNRDNAYHFFGFDEYYTIDDFPSDAEIVHGNISDKACYDKIFEVVENKNDPSDPQFVFAITMQNHSSYASDDYPIDVETVGYSDQSVDRYLSLVKNTDEATKYLIEYFEKCNEPTMVVMFGDHNPGLPQSFEEYLSGDKKEALDPAETEKYYETPFFIWTNYDMESRENVITSLNYLSVMMLQETGLEMTDYEKYLADLSKTIKACNFIGYYNDKDEFIKWSDAEGDILRLRNEYERFQYNDLVDSVFRMDWFFKIQQ